MGIDPLLQGGVVELLVMTQHGLERGRLARAWIEFVCRLASVHATAYRSAKELEALYHCIYSLHYHLVIVTKYRRQVLTAAMLDRFEFLARERVEAWGGGLIEVNGEADHVHLLFTQPPNYALANFVNALKTGTSRRLRSEFAAELNQVYRKPVLWSRSYGVISCSGAPLSLLKQYIENQERPE